MTAGVTSPGAIRTDGRKEMRVLWEERPLRTFGARVADRIGLWCKVKVVRWGKCKGMKKDYRLSSFRFERVRYTT